nr:pentatricopeptide repeat-containing protein At1g32415, mitochondrial isoform X1 [Quercus suber]XP_023885817.1 pentatricopeptide repeat-containing protein At1g32415, mitochondrial isoform X1 [Quercus suber]
MPAFSFRVVHLSSLSKISTKLQCRFIYARHFETQVAFSKTHYRKLTNHDSQLLHYLSKYRLQDARNMLDELPHRDQHGRIVHWTSLLSKYSKNGFVDEARALFDMMPERNVVTYNAMLSGYVQTGRLSEAWRFFEVMPERNVVSWTSMLCGLADAGRIDEARRLFEEMPERNVVSWNSMVVGLIRNGNLEEARMIFQQMPDKDVVSWNAMIAGYAECCRMEEAKVLFDEMQERNVVTWTTMIAGYCRVGSVEEGYYLFRIMPERNVVSWTAMIGGFTWNGFYKEALLLFREMRGCFDLKPNEETFVSLAYACAGMRLPRLGMQLHAQLIINSWDYNDYDGRLSRSLLHMYSMFGMMDFAHYICSKNPNKCTVQSYNSLINGYIRIGQLEKAQNLFDVVPVRDKISWTSMINGYLSFGQVSKACHLFYNMPERDAVAWTAMISGHVQNELFAEATYLFSEMRAQGVSPLNSTYSTLLGATGALSHLDQGRQFHCMLMKTLYEFDLILENSLISMYAKCGEIEDAYCIFSNMIYRDSISWNSMIMGFSHHGLANETLTIFEDMLRSGNHPNSVTFLGVLSACSHAGLVNRGWELFSAMSDAYAIQPGLEHYICMINLLGRAGKVKEAEELVLRLPLEPDYAIWGSLLGVCGFHETNAKIARRAAKCILELDPLNASAHVVLCNIYAANGRHVEETMLRKEMKLKGVRKAPGCSWIMLKGKAHVFLSGNKLHSQVDDMLSLLYVTGGIDIE